MRSEVKLSLRPISLKAANEYVAARHRHHGPTQGHKFSVSVVDDSGEIRGVGIAGRPVSRGYDPTTTLEVTRVCTDGAANACSMIYGALRRAAIALGYKAENIITYTLASEEGGSLRASGWVQDGEVKGRSWSVPSRPREDKAPIEDKIRWRAA